MTILFVFYLIAIAHPFIYPVTAVVSVVNLTAPVVTEYELDDYDELDAMNSTKTVAIHLTTNASETTIGPVNSHVSWALDRLDQPNGLDSYYNPRSAGKDVDVYILDTGITPVMGEFLDENGNSRILGGASFIDPDHPDETDTEDCFGHGTAMASTAAGITHGVATKANLWSLKVLGCNGQGSLYSALAAFRWIRRNIRKRPNKPAVINISFYSEPNEYFDVLVAQLAELGASIVASAGNRNVDACNYSPGRSPHAITVGALNQDDVKLYRSGTGRCVDFYMPGIDMPAFNHRGDVMFITGTSPAAALTTGVVATYRRRYPKWSPEKIKALMTKRGKDIELEERDEFPNATEPAQCEFLEYPRKLSLVFRRNFKPVTDYPRFTWLKGHPEFRYWNTSTGVFRQRFSMNNIIGWNNTGVLISSMILANGDPFSKCPSPAANDMLWVMLKDGQITSNQLVQYVDQKKKGVPSSYPIQWEEIDIYKRNGYLDVAVSGVPTVRLRWAQSQKAVNFLAVTDYMFTRSD